MLEELFKFPIVMIDGDNEERKQAEQNKLGLPVDETEEEYDMVFGEAEYPYWDFIGIEDRWLPSKDSLNKALTEKFEACTVRFANVGQLLVPWTRKKFKTEIQKFAADYEATRPAKVGETVKIVTLTPEQFKKATDDTK